MWIGVVTLFPEMVQAVARTGVLARALAERGLVLATFNPRDHAPDRHRTVDDRPYGGGPGMILMAAPLLAAIEAAQAAAPGLARVVYLSPQGPRLDQARVMKLAEEQALILLAGRYEGIDERVIELAVDEELSIGDYVLTGGELAAMVVMDAISRYLPGTLGNAASVADESHLEGTLEYPHYTRPERVGDLAVPTVLLSGDHRAIARWRKREALLRTWDRRPDMLAGRVLTTEERAMLEESSGDSDAGR